MRLPSASLETLILRGDVVYTGQPATRVHVATARHISYPVSSPLVTILPIFLQRHRAKRWMEIAGSLQVPEPSSAAVWLHNYEATESELISEWTAFIQKEH